MKLAKFGHESDGAVQCITLRTDLDVLAREHTC